MLLGYFIFIVLWSGQIWSMPRQRGHLSFSLTQIQQRGRKINVYGFAAHKLNVNMDLYHRSDTLGRLNLDTLRSRRLLNHLCFVFKLLSGLINCPELLSSIRFHLVDYANLTYFSFHITLKTMASILLYIDITLYLLNTSYQNKIDIFYCTLPGSKKTLKNVLTFKINISVFQYC